MEEGKVLNLNEILDKHKKWLSDEDGGERANLRGANLHGANLSSADLRKADLCSANLSGANLRDADLCSANLSGANLCDADLNDADLSRANLYGANLRDADLSRANLYGANLRDADLSDANLSRANLNHANLSGAYLCGANLSGAYLCGANLSDADLNGAILYDIKADILTTGYWSVCPEEGAFIGYKKAHGCIVKLRIPETAKRSSATTRKCRCSEAEVLAITDAAGMARDAVASNYDSKFIYRVGETVTVPDFDDHRWYECSAGIHFFITRKEAEEWTD